MLALFNLSPAGLIFIHVIGILAVFMLGYSLGLRKFESQQARRPRKSPKLSGTRGSA
jgi:hypothetical protein